MRELVNTSYFKVFIHLLAWIPLVWLFYAAFHRLLGGDPQTKLMHELGLWSLIYLLLCLSMTPAKLLTSNVPWIKFRRLLGLYSAFYAFLHVICFFIFYLQLDIQLLFQETLERPYITVGMLAFILLIPLIVTSNRASQRKLGKSWKRLHQLSYFIAVLVIIHFVWQVKADLNEPIVYIVWAILIVICRFIIVYKRSSSHS
ncbi:sulfite oxidase heme-binding subunit YedZ [Aliikangiella sp. IMCC44653]